MVERKSLVKFIVYDGCVFMQNIDRLMSRVKHVLPLSMMGAFLRKV